MPRARRLVVPDVPHHIVQRGNRQQTLFHSDADRRNYVTMLAVACREHKTRCLAWCLMDNHIHLILVPPAADALRAIMSSVHTRFAQRVNKTREESGHLFQGRFASYPMDDAHLMVAVRYVENNPAKAGLVAAPGDWVWSSARAHLGYGGDPLTDVVAIGQHVGNWAAYLADGLEAADRDDAVEAALRTGRPLGAASWAATLRAPSAPRGRRWPVAQPGLISY